MKRIKIFQKFLKKTLFDGFLIENKTNIEYLTNTLGVSGYLIIFKDSSYFLTNIMDLEKISNISKCLNIIILSNNSENELSSAVLLLFKKRKVNNICFEKSIPFFKYNIFKKEMNKLKCNFIIGPSITEELRMIKDKNEIFFIKKSATIADNIFNKIINEIKQGITELEIKNMLKKFLLEEKNASFSFETIVTSGKRTASPHGIPTKKKILNNEPILLDFGIKYMGYCSDMTRMIYLGKPSNKFLNIYNIVYNAKLKALDKIKNAKYFSDIDNECRNFIKSFGYGDNFIHSTGHGIGLSVHEEPNININTKIPIVKNIIFTVEPGIYLKDEFGIRIEDLVFFDGENIEILSKTKSELIIL